MKWISLFSNVLFLGAIGGTPLIGIIKEDCDSRLICINSRKMWDEAKEPYVFPKHCNHVFFYLDVLDRDWWFVLTHDTRSKHIFEKNIVIMPYELEDNEGDHENRE